MDRPMLFSGSMMRAILAGTKTNTRRLPKILQSIPDDADEAFYWSGETLRRDGVGVAETGIWARQNMTGSEDDQPPARSGGYLRYIGPSPWNIGDRLYAREAWRTVSGLDHLSPAEIGQLCLDEGFDGPWMPMGYLADGERSDSAHWSGEKPGRYRHGRFMPRWASRATLTVTGVKVERLQDISEADALAEGIDPLHSELASYHYTQRGGEHTEWEVRTLKPAYRRIWEVINGPGSWDMNPFVVAPAFTVELANIDSLGATP